MCCDEKSRIKEGEEKDNEESRLIEKEIVRDTIKTPKSDKVVV